MFIILGIVILFIFLFLIQVTSNAVNTRLSTSQEDVLSKIFSKEALRIFVEDCLSDELEEGIRLVGKQSRLWDNQPGGQLHFQDGVTGVQYLPDSESRIAYALTKKPYLTHQNAFPCNLEDNTPFFCKYAFPQQAEFGSIERWERNIERDLEEYLKIQAQECINSYLEERVPNAQFTSSDFTLTADMQDDGILVIANYPLNINVGGEDFFHLSVFDFFYPSGLRRMLRSSFFFPIEMDYRYADFKFTRDTLRDLTFPIKLVDGSTTTRWTFKRDYEALQISMQRVRIETPGETFGDTVFTFTSPFPQITDLPLDFVLRLARQNRAPALDYVHNAECLVGEKQYDYLIVPGDTSDNNYGQIDITLSAIDPDEDGERDEEGVGEDDIKYYFTDVDGVDPPFNRDYFWLGTDPAVPADGGLEANRFLVSKEQLSAMALEQRPYTFTAKVKDKYGAEDWQKVRLFVDRPINPERDLKVGVSLPYSLALALPGGGIVDYADALGVDTSGVKRYAVSPQDPIFISVTIPRESADSTATRTALTSVTFTPDDLSIPAVPIPVLAGANCVNVQDDLLSCSFSVLPLLIENWGVLANDPIYNLLTRTPGTLQIDFSANYCGVDNSISSQHSVRLEPQLCLPHRNVKHQIPYVPSGISSKPYYQWVTNEDGKVKIVDGVIQKEDWIHPLEASHACCVNDGGTYGFAPTDKTCFYNPEPSCTDPITSGEPGYEEGEFKLNSVLAQQTALCGSEGLCSVAGEFVPFNNELRCGTHAQGCRSVNPGDGSGDDALGCQGQLAWSYVKRADNYGLGFCHGNMGCQSFCSREDEEELVLETDSAPRSNKVKLLKDYALTKYFVNDEGLVDDDGNKIEISCGCGGSDDIGKPCDGDFDGRFDGTCKSDLTCYRDS